jgi:hypothetical protein
MASICTKNVPNYTLQRYLFPRKTIDYLAASGQRSGQFPARLPPGACPDLIYRGQGPQSWRPCPLLDRDRSPARLPDNFESRLGGRGRGGLPSDLHPLTQSQAAMTRRSRHLWSSGRQGRRRNWGLVGNRGQQRPARTQYDEVPPTMLARESASTLPALVLQARHQGTAVNPSPDVAPTLLRWEEINQAAWDGTANGHRPDKAMAGSASQRRKRAECVAIRAKFVGAGRTGSSGSGSSRWARRRGGC